MGQLQQVIKFQGCYQNIKSQKMQSPASPPYSKDACLLSSCGSSQGECAVFEKYKSGLPLSHSAFRLCALDGSSDSDSDETPNSQAKARGSYRKYTLQEKQMAVFKILNGHDVKEISREFGIPRRNLLRWRKNGCERKEGGGRPTDHEMECILYEKIRKREINGEKQIRAAAIEVSKSQNFKASKGWFSKFCRRYKVQTGQDLLKA